MYYGDTIAEKAMMRLNAKIKKTFAQAYREMSEKLQSHTKQFEEDDKKYREMVKSGKLSQKDYNKWKQSTVFTGTQWKNMISDITGQIAHADKTTERMINGERRAVFQENVNYSSYNIDKDYNFVLTFTIYDSATVTRLIKEDPQLLPDVKVDEEGYQKWSKQLVSSAVTQSIIQGETIPQTAKRIGEKVSSSNEKAMTRVARTAMTSAQNSGRIEAMHNAKDMGINVKKLWIATLDRRTRDVHGELDGQTAEVDDPFHSSLGDIYYPGDPNAKPANVWNCRCSLGWEYPEYQNQYDTRAAREYDDEEDERGHTVEVPYMTYAEWKEQNDPKLRQKEIKTETKSEKTETSEVPIEDIAKHIEYGVLFSEEAKEITERTLEKLYKLYPIDHTLEFVGDVRINRGYDQEEDALDLSYYHKELTPCGAQYIADGNKVTQNGNHCIEIHNEMYGYGSLKEEFNALYEIKERYGVIDVKPDNSHAFFASSNTLEGTLTHEYGHAVEASYGFFGNNTKDEKSKEYREWMIQYFYDHRDELNSISQYAASHPDEMFAEAFVQRFDTEHKNSLAYKLADEIMTKFDETFGRNTK